MSITRGRAFAISASSVKSASGTSAVGLPESDAGQFLLNVTASSTPTTLDVYLQTSPNAGTTWYDFAHFSQVGAVTTAIQSLIWQRKPQELNTTVTGVTVTGDAALAAGVVIQGPIVSNYFRAKWVIVGTSYTFSVTAILDRD
jgi:hypothetical protein